MTTKKAKQEVIPAKDIQDTAPDNQAVMHDPETRIIAERVLALHQDTQWDLPVARGKPLAGDALQNWLRKKEDQSAVSCVERGVGYALLKREMGHGAFEGWLRDNGIPPSSARYDRQVAQLYMNLSATNRRRAVGLPQRKLAALASAPAPIIDDLFDSGALDDAADMSREELRELIRLRKEVEHQAEREGRLNAVIAEQREELRKVRAMPETQPYLLEMRRAVLDETASIRANAAALQGVMDRVATLPADLPAHEVDAIVHPLMFALQALQATTTRLFTEAFDRFEHYRADLDVPPPLLTAEEAAAHEARFDDFRDAAWVRELRRREEAGMEVARKRGRPAGSGKKKGARR